MKAATPVLALALFLPAQASAELDRMLSRLAEEAEVFAHASRKTIGQETLRQKSLKPKPRFRPRIGAAALKPVPREYQTREIVSEYGFTSLQDAPEKLHEIRQVISVDGRQVRSAASARETLTLGMTTAEDRKKKKMLQEFENYGLIGAVMNFGQVIVLFNKRSLPNYSFQLHGKRMIGPDSALVYSFHQVAGPDPVTFFEGRNAIRRKLQGFLWVRESDYLPLRITLTSTRENDNKELIVSEGVVDYQLSRFAILLPASVVYREHVNNMLLTESIFEYTGYHQFGAQSEIQFEVEPEPPK